MKEKLQELLLRFKAWKLSIQPILDALKAVALFVCFPVLVTIAYIFHLRNKVADLESEVELPKAEKDLAESIGKLAELKKEADDAEKKYKSDRDSIT